MRALCLALLMMGLALGAAAQTGPFAAFEQASDAVLNDPHDLVIGPDGLLYVADKFGNRIVVMDPETLEILHTSEPIFPGIHDISFDRDGDAWVASTGASRVDRVEIEGDAMRITASFHGLSRTEGVLAHSNGAIYAVASGTGAVVRFDEGQPVAMGEVTSGAHDIAEAPDGTLWVADTFGRRLVQFSQDLEMLGILNEPAFGLVGPRYLDITAGGYLMVADQDAHRILLIDPVQRRLLGVIGDGVPGIGPGKFDDPEGVAIDGSRYFFADSDNNRITRYVVVLN